MHEDLRYPQHRCIQGSEASTCADWSSAQKIEPRGKVMPQNTEKDIHSDALLSYRARDGNRTQHAAALEAFRRVPPVPVGKELKV